jgi:hypothetical protein
MTGCEGQEKFPAAGISAAERSMKMSIAAKQYRVNVYEHPMKMSQEVIARVRYNTVLDYWDGHNWKNGGPGWHKGITKLKDGRYVIIIGTDWQGQQDHAYVVAPEEALQEILRSQNLELLKTKKFKELKRLYEKTLPAEKPEAKEEL